MVAQKGKNGTLKTSKVKVQIELDAEVNELLGLMLHKAQLSKSDLMQEFVARWVSQNFDDLLSEAEQKPFKNLFYYAKKTEGMS
jgi:hypothetical protein